MTNASLSTALTLRLRGAGCASCVNKIESRLQKVPGVDEARVNLAEQTLTVRGGAVAAACVAAVEELGYGAELVPGSK